MSGSIAFSTQGGANALSISQAANGSQANSQTLASDQAASNATGNGISVAGGCAIFVGCGFAIAQTSVNPLGPDTSVSQAVAITNSSASTGGIGAVAEASAAGGSGNSGQASSIQPNGGSFSFTSNTGSAATVAAVGVLPGTIPATQPFP